MEYYKIVTIILQSEAMPARFDAFRMAEVCDAEREQALKIRYVPCAGMRKMFRTVSEVSGLRIGPSEDGWVFEEADTGLRMQINADYSEAVIGEETKETPHTWAFFLQLFLEGRLLDEGVLTLHSSCVELDGKAWSFSGPSGCGKSTRARQWVSGLCAAYLSGDRPAVHVAKRRAYGIPWDGKEQIFRNASAEIGAVFKVRRASFTRLRTLSPKQARAFLISQIYVPMWDSERAMKAMLLLNRLTGSVPIFRLFCGPEESAALETREMIMNTPETIREESIDMKLKDGFELKSMAGEYVLMPTGENIAKFNGSVLLNELSAFVIQKLTEGPLSKEDLADLILAEYEADREVVLNDLEGLAQQLAEMGVITLA